MNVKVYSLLVGVVIGTHSIAAVAQQPDTQQRTTDEADSGRSSAKATSAEFTRKAISAGLAEVALGKLGAQRAKDTNVRTLSRQVAADQEAVNVQLVAVAKSYQLDAPASPATPQKASLQRLEQQSGKDFDRELVRQMVRDHEAAVALYESVENDKAIELEVRTLATKALPTLRLNLAQASELATRFDR
jgi:putative membrane protein